MPRKSQKRKKTNWVPFFWWFGIFPRLLIIWEIINEDLRLLEAYWNGPDSEALRTNDKAEMLKVVKLESYQEGRDYLKTLGYRNTLYSIEYIVKKALGLPDDFNLGKIPENIFFEVSMEVFNIFLLNMTAVMNLGGISAVPEDALKCDSLSEVNEVLLKRVEILESKK